MASLLLLMAINLFNYVDRQVLSAVEPDIRRDILHEPVETAHPASSVPRTHAHTRTGILNSAFIVCYMLAAPLFGWLADRMSRWVIVGGAVVVWSLASGASGLASSFTALLVTRLFIGVGEAGYGPAAPTIIADLFPMRRRGTVMAWFYMAIPVGSALGYVLAGMVARFTDNWRWSFYAVVPPGIALGLLCFFMPDPPRGQSDSNSHAPTTAKPSLRDYLHVFQVPSYLLNTVGMAMMTFGIMGITFFMPSYLLDQHAAHDPARAKIIYGILILFAGVSATLSGGFIGDWLQERFGGAYFLVSAAAIFLSVGCILMMLFSTFPTAWGWLFGAAFFLFFTTGPANTILANVIHPSMRTTAFALNIFLIYALGAIPASPLMGELRDRYHSWRPAFYLVCAAMTFGGFLWVWGARYLASDTERAMRRDR